MKQRTARLQRILALLLGILFVFSTTVLPLSATNSSTASQQTSAPLSPTDSISDTVVIDPIRPDEPLQSLSVADLKQLGEGEKPLLELREMQVDLSALPEFIPTAAAQEKGHVNRLAAQEPNLHTVIYQNQDGTRSTYLFSRPVKYVAADGSVRDKSTAIAAVTDATYAYAMTDNSVRAYFAKTASNGMTLQADTYTIIQKPITVATTAPTYYAPEKRVVYADVFGAGTLLSYQTLQNGVKEDIILVKNTGQNTFLFTLTVTGLTPVLENGTWYLKNAADEKVATFGAIAIADSAGNTATGTMEITATAQSGVYQITVTAPQDFLNAPTTVYPVYIDPTTQINEYNYYAGQYDVEFHETITDTGLYSTQAAADAALANPSYHTLNANTGRVIYRLYDFCGSLGLFKSTHPEQIGAAHLYFNVGTGTATTVTAHPMTSATTSATAVYDSTLWNAYSTAISSSLSLDSTAGERGVDITDIVRGWAEYNQGTTTTNYKNPANGFVLISSSASNRQITAVENDSYFTTDVYVRMDTSTTGGEYYVYNSTQGDFLKRNTSTTLTVSGYEETNNIQWCFDYLGNDQYYIRSAYNKNYVLRGVGSTLSLAYLPSNPPAQYIWTVEGATGGGVIIKNANSNYVLRRNSSATTPLTLTAALASTDSNYEQTVWGIVAEYKPLTAITVTNVTWIAVGSEKNISINATPYGATGSSAKYFKWASEDPTVATVNASGRITGVSTGYTKISATHKLTDVTYSFYVTVGQIIPNATYYAMNSFSGRYLDLEGASLDEGAPIQQWSLHDYDQGKWVFVYNGDGYYLIQSKHSQKYVSVYSDPDQWQVTEGTAIVQKSVTTEPPAGSTVVTTPSDSLWRILKTESGAYKIVSKRNSSYVLGIPKWENSDGTNCVLKSHMSDRDEWYLSDVRYRVNITVLFDHGHVGEYVDLVSPTNQVRNIMKVVQKKYAEYFGICINFSTPTLFTSYADECESEGVCTHGDSGLGATGATNGCQNSQFDPNTHTIIQAELHHKNLTNILARLPLPDLTNSTVLAFIGDDTCYEYTVQEGETRVVYHSLGLGGMAVPDWGIAAVDSSYSDNNESLMFTTFHEIGHWFRAPDHYDIAGQKSTADLNEMYGTNSFNSNCVYGENKDNYRTGTNYDICDGCRSIIQQNASRFGH